MKDFRINFWLSPYSPGVITLIVFMASASIQCKPLQNERSFKVLAKSFELKYSVDSITAKQLHQIQNSQLPLLLYDVRHSNEQKVSMIPGAIAITIDTNPSERKDFKLFIKKNKGNANARIVFYCAVGHRSSQKAAQLIKNLDLKNNSVERIPVKNLFGGLFLWAKNKYKMIEPNTGKKTITVHGYNNYWAGFVKKPVKVVIQPPVE